jgi:4-amino-4-deoxy-L-arabinose transferase-like glycosyltransferase
VINFIKKLNLNWFWIILIIGALVRTWNFPNIPGGLNQDELASGYESFSLLLTGADKWGNSWPMYFPAWGSGQSVLLAYLQIPFISIFGLNTLAVRLPSLILGILILPLVYLVSKRFFDQKTALVSMFLVAVLPWPIIISRWGLEANLLPFFVLLGVYCLSLAWGFGKIDSLKSPTKKNLFDKLRNSKFWPLIGLLPLAIAIYSYALGFFLIGFLLLLILILNYPKIKTHKTLVLSSLVPFVLIITPFLVFFFKNYVVHSNLGFESSIPITIPLLGVNRADQISVNYTETLAGNIYFLIAGFVDTILWNNDPSFLPLGMTIFPFLIYGIYFIFKNTQWRQNLILLWFLAFLPILLMIPMNTTRGNSFLLAVILISSFGIVKFTESLKDLKIAKFAFAGAIIWILLYSITFMVNYMYLYPKKSADSFNSKIEMAMNLAEKNTYEGEKIYLTQEVSINYLYPVFYKQIDPRDFRKESTIEFKEGGYNVNNWKNYYFDRKNLDLRPGESFVFILKSCMNEWCDQYGLLYKSDVCKNFIMFEEIDFWRVGRCYS